MAIMFPANINEYLPTDSEAFVYKELKSQLPDNYTVFYSVNWSEIKNGRMIKSEADFIVMSPEFGFVCLEVKGSSLIRIENNEWFVFDNQYGERKLKCSPYEQAEKSMYHFKDEFQKKQMIKYSGIYAAAAVFPFFNSDSLTEVSGRNKECTIDCKDMDQLYIKIKQIFKAWGGPLYGRNRYDREQHTAFSELIKHTLAVSAAAGALVKYKERQLDTINRVQDNYIYFLTNIRQFYVKGGAGTGKTWIAMKMAKKEAMLGNKVLFTCMSQELAKWIKRLIGDNENIDVFDLNTLVKMFVKNPESLEQNSYDNILDSLTDKLPEYDAVFIDEAQDLSEELAVVIKMLLKNEEESRLGIFYDDVQNLRDRDFGNAFMISTPPFLLKENIRNTANIYNWATQHTDLGSDVIVNPVEGPNPKKEYINNIRHLEHRLENILRTFLVKESLATSSLVILVDDILPYQELFHNGLASWRFCCMPSLDNSTIQFTTVYDFKGLEADMIIYIHSDLADNNVNYTAYTRAKYYLHELVLR